MWNFALMRPVMFFFIACVSLGSNTLAQQQVNSGRETAPAEPKIHLSQSRPDARGSIYEDREIKVSVPWGWKILKVGSPDDPLVAHPPSVAQTFIPPPGRGLLLESRGYTLTLAYTGHGSPILGGRFPEVFTIPWPSDVWACGVSFRKNPVSSSGRLKFFSLILDNPTAQEREFCGLPEHALFANRWFAGYFSSVSGRWFFRSKGPDCPEKAYTLTTEAKTPSELPDASDSVLNRVIKEAIGIVASIRYKRCPPAPVP